MDHRARGEKQEVHVDSSSVALTKTISLAGPALKWSVLRATENSNSGERCTLLVIL